MAVRVQFDDFDVGAEIAALRQGNPLIGAVASFIGVARDRNDGAQINTLTLEHYPGMTERALQNIADRAHQRWSLLDVLIVHRVGTLAPTDQIVLVVTTSAHRQAAFAACEFIMDVLKTDAPFWKREDTPEGGRWVDTRDSDAQARKRWDVAPPSNATESK